MTIAGTPTKSGVYWVQIKAKNASGYQWAENVKVTVSGDGKEAKEPKLTRTSYYPLTVICANEGGTVSGTGVYAAGKKVSVKATPTKGYVFAGWHETANSEKGTVNGVDGADYRSASLNVTVPETRYVFALFATKEDDADSLKVAVEDVTTEKDGTIALNLGACVESLSLPKLAVSGLPTGLKYDTKSLKISGKATKPGVYTVTVKATNAAVTKATDASTTTFRITVPNFECAALPGLKPETDAYGIVRSGVIFDDGLVDCSPANGWTVKVAGLPSGLKWDAKTGKIVGVPTAKAGSYTVTFTASKKDEANQIATITLNVEALPDWVVGTFYGKNVARGLRGTWTCPQQFTVTISANGKISMKTVSPGEGAESRTAQLTECREDGSFAFSFHYASGRKGKDGYSEGDCAGIISPVAYGEDGALLGCLTTQDIGVCDEDDDPFESKGVVYQSLYSRKPAVSGLPVFGKDNIRVVPVKSDCSDGEVTLKFGTKGAVTAAWSGTKPIATCSSYISPYARDADGTVHAKLWLTFLDKTRMNFHGHPVQTGFDFDLEIPSAVPAAASNIKVASVRIESILVDFAHGGPYEIDVGDLPDWTVGSFYGWEQWIEDGDSPSNLDMDIQGFTVGRSGWLSEFHGTEDSGNTWSEAYPSDYLPQKLGEEEYEWGIPSSEKPVTANVCLRKSLVVSKFLYADVEVGKATLDAYFSPRGEPNATQYAEFIQDPWALPVIPRHLPAFDSVDNVLVLDMTSYYGPITARLTFGERGNVSVSWSGSGILATTTETRLMPYDYDDNEDVCHALLPIFGGKAVKYGFSVILDMAIPNPDSARASAIGFSVKARSWQIGYVEVAVP